MEILRREIDFVSNDAFHHEHAANEILSAGEVDQTKATSPPPRDLPGHLARLCDTPLLTAEGERDLFRRMNFLKYCANTIRCSLNPEQPNVPAMAECESLLAEAEEVRDQLIRANLRLVISVVKKFVSPQNSFDELLSEGIMTVMRTVDKFDFDRGFRFSTYAYRSIARNLNRLVTNRGKEHRRRAAAAECWDIEDPGETVSLDEQTWESLRGQLGKMLTRLDDRERFIVQGRFALGKDIQIRTCQSLADELGISKERVRQLEQRAIGKLRKAAEKLDIDTLVRSRPR